jgi:hypothetical protein
MTNFGLVKNPKLKHIPVIHKGLKIIQNIIQYLLYKYSRFHYLEPPRKGVIEKMANLVDFWLILESELV